MAMKKRFLPALMAGMVVVGSTGLANADTGRVTLEGPEANGLSTPVEITGTVHGKEGEIPGGRLSVELPTKMAFTVNKDGVLSGANYEVKNNSNSQISVKVSDFRRKSGNITIVDQIGVGSPRGNVSLRLIGTDEVPLLLKPQPDREVLQVAANDVKTIRLAGEGGVAAKDGIDATGATGEFDMTFKISKVDA